MWHRADKELKRRRDEIRRLYRKERELGERIRELEKMKKTALFVDASFIEKEMRRTEEEIQNVLARIKTLEG